MKDLPADFEQRREENYKALKHPLDGEKFISSLKESMHEALSMFNNGLPKNSKVKLSERAGGWINLSPLAPQPEPQNLFRVKAEVSRLWPMTNLLDVLKEADLRLSFTD